MSQAIHGYSTASCARIATSPLEASFLGDAGGQLHKADSGNLGLEIKEEEMYQELSIAIICDYGEHILPKVER